MMLGTYEDEPIVLDAWQVAHMHDYGRLRAREKAPQIGFSWGCALEAVWEAVLFEDATMGFVSVDQREANEKILYARKAYEGLPLFIQRWVPMIKEAQEELNFGSVGRPSRVMSIPATSALRGRKMSVVLDEVDFYKDGGANAYRVSLGRIARGGRVTMGSTVFGTDTVLDRVMQGLGEDGEPSDQAKVFSRARFPWPVVENPQVLQSVELARQALHQNDFAEEYECVRGGGALDTFPAELLRSQQHDLPGLDRDSEGKLHPSGDGPLVGGYDVGQSRHPSVLSLFERGGDGVWRQVAIYEPVRRGRMLSLPEQHEWLREFLRRVPTLRIALDAKGIGAHIGEALVREFSRRRVIAMQPGSKPTGMRAQDRGEMTIETKRALEAGELELLPDKEQTMQFRRTRVLPTGTVDQPGSRRKSHYDRFWATAYAAYGIAASGRTRAYAGRGLSVAGVSGSALEVRPGA